MCFLYCGNAVFPKPRSGVKTVAISGLTASLNIGRSNARQARMPRVYMVFAHASLCIYRVACPADFRTQPLAIWIRTLSIHPDSAYRKLVTDDSIAVVSEKRWPFPPLLSRPMRFRHGTSCCALSCMHLAYSRSAAHTTTWIIQGINIRLRSQPCRAYLVSRGWRCLDT